MSELHRREGARSEASMLVTHRGITDDFEDEEDLMRAEDFLSI